MFSNGHTKTSNWQSGDKIYYHTDLDRDSLDATQNHASQIFLIKPSERGWYWSKQAKESFQGYFINSNMM